MFFGCAQVQKAFDAKHVISVCSSLDSSRATQALQRLLDNADTIMGMVDLAGAPIHPEQITVELWCPKV